MVLKPGESRTLELGTELTMGKARLQVVTYLQPGASRMDVAAHLRAVAAAVEHQVTW